MGSNRPGESAPRWLDALEAFAVKHGRMPYPSDPTERRLAEWVRHARNGNRAMRASDRRRLDDVLARTPRRRKPKPDPMVNVPHIVASSRERGARAAQRAAELARRRLYSGDFDPRYREVLRVRVEYPTATLERCGAVMGLSKAAYAQRLQRAFLSRNRTNK